MSVCTFTCVWNGACLLTLFFTQDDEMFDGMQLPDLPDISGLLDECSSSPPPAGRGVEDIDDSFENIVGNYSRTYCHHHTIRCAKVCLSE